MTRNKITRLFLALIFLAPSTAKAALEPRVEGASAAPKTETRPADYPGGFPDTPQNHWAYVAVAKLESGRLIQWYEGSRESPLPPLMTRYEFAVETARAMDKLANVAPADTLRFADMTWTQIEHEIIAHLWLSQFDASLTALQTEFAPEIKRLSIRVDSLEKRVPPVPNTTAKTLGRRPTALKCDTQKKARKPEVKTKAKTKVKPEAETYLYFPDTPQNHWAYLAVNRLERARIIASPSISAIHKNRKSEPSLGLMRYEFAVATARTLDAFSDIPPVETLRLDRMSWKQIRDEMLARMWLSQFDADLARLQIEFADELARLGVRNVGLETRIPLPPKEAPPTKKPSKMNPPAPSAVPHRAIDVGSKSPQ